MSDTATQPVDTRWLGPSHPLAPKPERTDEERAVLAKIGPLMAAHEPRWSSGACQCGAKLGDSIDWNWHLANQAVLFALRKQLPFTDAQVEAAAAQLWASFFPHADWSGIPEFTREGFRLRARSSLETARAAS